MWYWIRVLLLPLNLQRMQPLYFFCVSVNLLSITANAFLSPVHVFILLFVLLCCRSRAEQWLPWSLISARACLVHLFHPQRLDKNPK